MRTALRDIGATARVAADDYIGLYTVLPFLQSRHVHVPRDLSLVSFNDQLKSGNACMSSFHFDMTGMAMRMLMFLLYPAQERRLRPGKQSSALEGIDGFIVDHGSLAGCAQGMRPLRLLTPAAPCSAPHAHTQGFECRV
jgi:hypothetical protein